MKKHIIALILFIFALALFFYLAPLLINNTGAAILMLLILFPTVVFICSLLYAAFYGFSPLTAPITAVLFIPTVFIFYNSSAWIYTVAYAVISLLGCVIGRLCRAKGK